MNTLMWIVAAIQIAISLGLLVAVVRLWRATK
jgi:hypothetical protein